MAWEQLSITKPHLVYLILGGFTTFFMLCSSLIKERLYIGEATVATLCGVIFGPHAANLINPATWGSTDIVTIEFSRIVLVVQCFAVGVELPKFYMERHWRSVIFLLVPVMMWGWLFTSLIIWWLVPPLSWLESLVVAACVTATDPVLASSVVGKGKFAKRIPKHLRDLLSAESGCNDGMAFPFVFLALYLIQDNLSAKEVTYHWICFTILYECVFGAFYGFVVGYIARHSIKYAEENDYIDRESLLVFYFVLALFCAGSGSLLGMDDLLVGFACGVGFSNDGWFTQKTEDAHVSNVIDLLINLAYFVYFGTIIPWSQFNNYDAGLSAWKLVILSLLVLFFRRIPIMMLLKPVIPDVKTWREGLFAGHFGPIGVGAIFVAMLARGELEHDESVPEGDPPTDPNSPHYVLITLIWPIISWLVMTSIIVHGSSIAVFTLGKHINTLTLTMSYTQAQEDGPSWMNRLPRISSQSKSQAASFSETDYDEKMPSPPPGTLPPLGYPGNFLRRSREGDRDGDKASNSRASSVNRSRRKKKWDDGIGPGGRVSQSAIYPQRPQQKERESSALLHGDQLTGKGQSSSPSGSGDGGEQPKTEKEEHREEEVEEEGADMEHAKSPGIEVYEEGDQVIVENEEGDVLNVDAPHHERPEGADIEGLKQKMKDEAKHSPWSYDAFKGKFHHWKQEEIEKRKEKDPEKTSAPARAYQFGNTIIVEDESGEVVKKYELPAHKAEGGGAERIASSLNTGMKMMGMKGLKKVEEHHNLPDEAEVSGSSAKNKKPEGARPDINRGASRAWTSYLSKPEQAERKREMEAKQQADDEKIRFTIGGHGQRMTKEDFMQEMRKLDKNTRKAVVDQSNAPDRLKELAKQDPSKRPGLSGHSSTSASGSGSGSAAAMRRKSASAAATIASSGTRPAQSRFQSVSGPSPESRKTQTARVRSHNSSGDDDDDEEEDDQEVSTSPMASPFANRDSAAPSREVGETAVERRRRLAVLKGVEDGEGDDDDDEDDADAETPAEKRRREAALKGTGPSSSAGPSKSNSDEDNGGGEPAQSAPARRGIRFAEAPERGRR